MAASLSIEQIIKWGLSALILVLVGVGVALFFKDQIIAFIEGLDTGNNQLAFFLGVVK